MYNQTHLIEFILNDVDSIRLGLKTYNELLKSDQVNLGNEMDVLFAYKERETLKPLQSHHGDLDLLKEVVKVSMNDYIGREQTFEDVTSEAIFFSHALLHGDLLKDVIASAKEIVAYARRHNDTWDMWADDMGVFGLDALYVLAKKHPAYSYLIGGFIVPYWDDEHADYAFRYLQQLYLDYGFNDDVMKTFCYCDSDQGRMVMLGREYNYELEDYLDLAHFFKEHPDKYDLFKEMLLDRYKNQPFLQYSNSDYTDRPIQKIYGIIMSSADPDIDPYEDDDYWAHMEQVFIEDSYDNESYKLQAAIEEALGHSLVAPQKHDEDEDGPSEQAIWKDFFVNGFEDGQDLWNYIMTGDGDPKTDVRVNLIPTDIRRLSKDKDLLFYEEKIQWFLGEYDTFHEEFHRIFEGFISTYYEESENGHRVLINGQDISGRDVVIRALDVFYRLMDERPFNSELFNLIRDYDVMTTEVFVERYDLNKPVSIATLSALLSDPIAYPEFISAHDMDRIYAYIEADRDRAHTLFLGKTASQIEAGQEEQVLLRGDITGQRDVQIALLKKGLYRDANLIITLAYLLERDQAQGKSDALNDLLMTYFDGEWLPLLLDSLESGSRLSKEDLGIIRKYLVGNPPPPRALFMKAMTQGKDALTEEERAMLNPNGSSVSLEEVLQLLKDKLKTAKRDRAGLRYKIFNSMSDYNLTYALSAFYYGAYRLNSKSSRPMLRALELFAALVPLKVMSIVYDMGHAQIKDYTTYDFRQDMRKLKIDPSMVLAMEIKKARGEDFDSYVRQYIEGDDEPSGGMIRDLSKREFKDALVHLDDYDKEKFYEEVALMSPENVDYLSVFLEHLKSFVEDNFDDDSCQNKAEKGQVVNKLHHLLETYVMDGQGLEEIIPQLDTYISSGDSLRKALWKMEDTYRNRFLKLLIGLGKDGIDAAISNDLIDDGYVSMQTFLACIHDLGAPEELLLEWGLEWQVPEALIIAHEVESIFPYIASLSIKEREKALEIVKNSPVMEDFVEKMTSDQSTRIKIKADQILKTFK